MLSGADASLALAVVVCAVGASTDARTGHIPNWLTLGGLAAGPVVAFALEAGRNGTRAGVVAAGLSLLGALVCCAGPLFAFFRGGLGGGDVKLLAAVGALLGPRLGIDAEFYAFVLGALYVPAKLAWRGCLFSTMAGAFNMLGNPFRKADRRAEMPEALRMRIRLGPAICAGTIIAVFLARAGA